MSQPARKFSELVFNNAAQVPSSRRYTPPLESSEKYPDGWVWGIKGIYYFSEGLVSEVFWMIKVEGYFYIFSVRTNISKV